MELNFWLHLRLTLLLIFVLISSACAPAAPADNIVIPPRASSTPAESPAATQPTESQAQPPSTQALSHARLVVISSQAKVVAREGIETEAQQAQSVNIRVGDGIEVLKLEEQEEQSHSILSFPDFLNVELFSNTNVFLADLQQGGEGSTDVTLDLDGGHMFVHLNDQTTSRVTVQTPYASIKTLTAGAEFNVCRNEGVTCVVVKRGVVEITAQGRKEIIKAGEAGFVVKDQHPSPAICAPLPVFIVWEERYRQFADTPALQEELSQLSQKPCLVTADGLPLNARILYRDEFGGPATGWDQGKIDKFIVSYIRSPGPRYYQVQAQGPEDRYLALVPDEGVYEDVNIDIRAFTEAASGGEFRYGLIFRRSENQYYAFAISPTTETWYFLKSSSNGLEVLKDGIDKRIRGLDAQDTLRVETYGSTFLVFINGRFIDWISDSEYASGEVGLFVETIDSPDALIHFDSIIVWNVPPETLNP